MDSRTAVGASTPLENVPNDVGERAVLFPSCALLAVAPGVVPSARHTEERTKAGYRERVALAFDEREDVGLRSEQNRMAFFRSACSSWSTAWAFSNAWSRLSSRTGTLGWRRARRGSFEATLSRLLTPPRQHHRMDVEGLRDDLDLHARDLCEPHRAQLELQAVAGKPLATETGRHRHLLAC